MGHFALKLTEIGIVISFRLQGFSAYSPAYVMLGGSGGFLFLQIHFSVVTPSASDATKQCGC